MIIGVCIFESEVDTHLEFSMELFSQMITEKRAFFVKLPTMPRSPALSRLIMSEDAKAPRLFKMSIDGLVPLSIGKMPQNDPVSDLKELNLEIRVDNESRHMDFPKMRTAKKITKRKKTDEWKRVPKNTNIKCKNRQRINQPRMGH